MILLIFGIFQVTSSKIIAFTYFFEYNVIKVVIKIEYNLCNFPGFHKLRNKTEYYMEYVQVYLRHVPLKKL